jgi:hypothetical protein
VILIILTEEGLSKAESELQSADTIWLNQGLLTEEVAEQLGQLTATLNELPEFFDVNKDKSLLAAFDYVERHSDDDDIIIECP